MRIIMTFTFAMLFIFFPHVIHKVKDQRRPFVCCSFGIVFGMKIVPFFFFVVFVKESNR